MTSQGYAGGVLSAKVQLRDAEGHGLSGVPVNVTFTPAVGAPVTVIGTTDPYGVALVGAHLKKVNTKDKTVEGGADSILEYIYWQEDGDRAHLARIIDYNREVPFVVARGEGECAV